jgi:hypothetical protein
VGVDHAYFSWLVSTLHRDLARAAEPGSPPPTDIDSARIIELIDRLF